MNIRSMERSYLLWLVTLLGILQGFAIAARNPPRSLLQGAQHNLTVTQAGCECPTSWTYVVNGNQTIDLSGCANPDKDAQGSWCPVDGSTCRSFAGVTENNGQAFAYDYCSPTRSRTKSGCLCRSRWFGFETNEDVGSKEYEGICASPDGQNKTPHCFIDPATCNANQLPANEKSTCEGSKKLPVDTNVGKKKTATGCECIPFKLALGPKGPFQAMNSCTNPDNDPKGSWCVVNRTSCPTFYSSFTQGFRSVFYDYCAPVRATTNAGCLCRTLWGPGSKYQDQCANPDGKAANWCTVIPGTCKGKAAGAYDSPVWDFCPADGKSEEGMAIGTAVGGGIEGNTTSGTSPLITGSPYPISDKFNTTGAPTSKNTKNFFDRNLGWIVGTIVGVVLLLFFIFTVRYLFCGKPDEEQMHTKGLLVPSTPSSKGSPASRSASEASSPTHSVDALSADAIIVTTPTPGTARSDVDKSYDSGKLLVAASDDDDLLDQGKKKSRGRGDSTLEVFVRRTSRRRDEGGEELDVEQRRPKGEARFSDVRDKRSSGGRSRKERSERDDKGRKTGGRNKLSAEQKASLNLVELRDSRDGFAALEESPRQVVQDNNYPDSNSYATKSFSKAASPVSKPSSMDWQTSINLKRSSKSDTADTPAIDLRASVANVLNKLTGKGKKAEDGDSPGTPKPAVPVQEAWEVYARSGNNKNTGSNRWATLPGSDQADALNEHGGSASVRASSDPSVSQASTRSSMLQSLLWMPRAKSWGMDFLQWKVPEGFTRSGSGDNVLKLGTIQSQDAMRVTPLPSSAKSNRVSVSLDDIVESPTASPPAGIPPKSSSGKLRGSAGSSDGGGSARFLLDSAKRRLLGIKDTSPSAPAADADVENPAARNSSSADNCAANEGNGGGTTGAQPAGMTPNSSWQMWSGNMSSSHKVQNLLETSPSMGLQTGVQMGSIYATAEMVSCESGAFTAHTAHSTWGESPSAGMSGPVDKSMSSFNSAATHFEPWQSKVSSPASVQPADGAVQWATPALHNATAGAPHPPHRVDSALLAKLLETESSSAATPVTIGQMVASPQSSLDARSPNASTAAKAPGLPSNMSASLQHNSTQSVPSSRGTGTGTGSKSESTFTWAATNLNRQNTIDRAPTPGAPSASASHLAASSHLSASASSLKERILADAAAAAPAASPMQQELLAAALAASSAGYKGSFASSHLREQIIAAATSGSFSGSNSNVNASVSSVNNQQASVGAVGASSRQSSPLRRHSSPLRRDVTAVIVGASTGSVGSNAGGYMSASPAKPQNTVPATGSPSASFAGGSLREQVGRVAMSVQSSTGVGSISLGGGSLKEQIVVAAAAAGSGGGARTNSVYATEQSGSGALDQPVVQVMQAPANAAPTQSSWNRVKSSGGPTIASTARRSAAATTEASNPTITLNNNVPDWKETL